VEDAAHPPNDSCMLWIIMGLVYYLGGGGDCEGIWWSPDGHFLCLMHPEQTLRYTHTYIYIYIHMYVLYECVCVSSLYTYIYIYIYICILYTYILYICIMFIICIYIWRTWHTPRTTLVCGVFYIYI